MAQKLFVGGLPFATSNDQLRDLFAEIGEVASATVVTDRDTGRSRGFGFVEMATVEAAAPPRVLKPHLAVGARGDLFFRGAPPSPLRVFRRRGRLDLVAVPVDELVVASHQIGPVGPDRHFPPHARPPRYGVEIRHTI